MMMMIIIIIFLIIIHYQFIIYWRQLHKNATSNIEPVMGAAPLKAAAVRPPTIHHENYQS